MLPSFLAIPSRSAKGTTTTAITQEAIAASDLTTRRDSVLLLCKLNAQANKDDEKLSLIVMSAIKDPPNKIKLKI
jgi:hypothetical protein